MAFFIRAPLKNITFSEYKFTYAKHRVDVLDKDNYYETKFVAAADGGTSIKVTTTFYTIGDIQISPDLMLQIKEASEKPALVLKAIENYVLANPDF
ncbi:hypothetical protein E1A91_D02G069400v1 [Gossypium mustelinum]|uniref:Bet v I/Major latex protein domain-containing protein n=1 Tax=Gossypium mustelinum TaxID=34275 RepID=A0A5D2VSW5_GOSMU|nr:hypothetical protein E1A91_D02G069400v1 [Gossypium mustelinum]